MGISRKDPREPFSIPGETYPPGPLKFQPTWGNLPHTGAIANVAIAADEKVLRTVRIRRVEVGGEPCYVLVPTEGEPDAELILLKEYAPGTGRKKWPSFRVEWPPDPQYEVLTSTRTSGGSGWEEWSLVVAPLGTADRVAGAFENRRGVGSQKIIVSADGSVSRRPGRR